MKRIFKKDTFHLNKNGLNAEILSFIFGKEHFRIYESISNFGQRVLLF